VVLLQYSVGMFAAFAWKNAFLRLADFLSQVTDGEDDDALRMTYELGIAVAVIIVLGTLGALYAHALARKEQEHMINAILAHLLRRSQQAQPMAFVADCPRPDGQATAHLRGAKDTSLHAPRREHGRVPVGRHLGHLYFSGTLKSLCAVRRPAPNVPPSPRSSVGHLQVIDADWARILLSLLYAIFAFMVGIAVAFWYYRRPPRLENVHQVRRALFAMMRTTPRPLTRLFSMA